MPEGDKILVEHQKDLNPCFYPESNKFTSGRSSDLFRLSQNLPIYLNRQWYIFDLL